MLARDGKPLAVFCGLLALSLLIYQEAVLELLRLALTDIRYSHLLTVPVISLFLLSLERRKLAAEKESWFLPGLWLMLPAVAMFLLSKQIPSGTEWLTRVSASASGLILFWISSFLFSFGRQAFHTAKFALFFLFLLVPMPPSLIDTFAGWLQKGSANTAFLLFRLFGIPVYREGLTLALPGVEIKVAAECSGIRSCFALFIVGVLGGHFLLQSFWARLCFIFITIPVAVLKNAARIVTISSLGVYVDRGFLYGRLHRNGGLPFSLLAFVMLIPAVVILRNWRPGVLGFRSMKRNGSDPDGC